VRNPAVERVEEQALDRYLHDCEATGHAMCSDLGSSCNEDNPLCEQAQQALWDSRRTEHDWSRFDVRQELLRLGSSFPDDRWSAPALLRLVHDSFMQGPLVHDAVRRSIWATAALARLAEAGVPPDVVVRTAMRDQLKRRITIVVISAAVDTTQPRPGWERVLHHVLEPWLELLQACGDQRLHNGRVPAHLTSEVAARALHGEFSVALAKWLKEASVADVLEWDLQARPHGPLDEADLVLRGGDAAGQWIYDRNVYTSLSDWRRLSLDWELRYVTASEVTAQDAGVPPGLLRQRPAYLPAVVTELVRRTRSPGVSDHVVAGLTGRDLLEQAVLLIGDGQQPEVPIRLLREAVRLYPQEATLRNTLGFCLIPTDPAAALQHFERCVPSKDVQAGLLAVNRAAALALLGRRAEALAAADSFADCGAQVLLWPCAPLLRGVEMAGPLESTTPDRWAAQLRQILAA